MPNPDKNYELRGLREYGSSSQNVPQNGVDPDIKYLTEEECRHVLTAAKNAEFPQKGSRKNHAVKYQKEYFENWERTIRFNSAKSRMYWERKPVGKTPIWADSISPKVRDRIYNLMNAIAVNIATIGGILNDDFSFEIFEETITVHFREYQDRTEHKLTETERKEMQKYEEESKKYSFAIKPQIRKYDYTYNGRLRMDIGNKIFRDNPKYTLEDYLGNIIIALFISAGFERQRRKEYEEAERKRKEIEDKKQAILNRYNKEIDRTNALLNAAFDYEIACKIRNYIQACSANMPQTPENEQWLKWADKKANWFDPTVAIPDEILGTRNYTKEPNAKKLEHRYSTHWIKLDEED